MPANELYTDSISSRAYLGGARSARIACWQRVCPDEAFDADVQISPVDRVMNYLTGDEGRLRFSLGWFYLGRRNKRARRVLTKGPQDSARIACEERCAHSEFRQRNCALH